MPLWWGQQGLYRVTEWKADVRPGGQMAKRSESEPMAQAFSVQGEYLEVDPPRLLVHTWIASYSPALKTVVRWELEARGVHELASCRTQKAGTGTFVKIRHEGFAGNVQQAKGHGDRLDPRARLDAGFCGRRGRPI